MSKIIAIANSKGGVGKSAISRNIALTCRANDQHTLALDCDPQKSLYKFFTARTERLESKDLDFEVHTEATGLKNYIQSQATNYDRIIIDVGGRDSLAMRAVLVAADVVLIPTTSGQESTDALEQMIEVVEGARAVNKALRAYIIINLAPADSFDQTASLTAEGLSELYAGQVEVLDSRIKYRKAWLQSGYDGHAVWEIPQKGENKAALVRFKAAYALVPSPITGLEVGKTQIDLGALVEAREQLVEVTKMPPTKPEHAWWASLSA